MRSRVDGADVAGNARASLVLVVLACIACVGVDARAESSPDCPQRVRAWTTVAAEAIDVPIETVCCLPRLTRLRLMPADAPPIDVELTRNPRRAFLTTSSGAFGLSPIVDVADYESLPAGQRRAVDLLFRWLADRVIPGEQFRRLRHPRGGFHRRKLLDFRGLAGRPQLLESPSADHHPRFQRAHGRGVGLGESGVVGGR